jgi:hypothetical protein
LNPFHQTELMAGHTSAKVDVCVSLSMTYKTDTGAACLQVSDQVQTISILNLTFSILNLACALFVYQYFLSEV